MVAGRVCQHALLLLFWRQLGDGVEGTAELKAPGLLEVFALEEDADFFGLLFICFGLRLLADLLAIIGGDRSEFVVDMCAGEHLSDVGLPFQGLDGSEHIVVGRYSGRVFNHPRLCWRQGLLVDEWCFLAHFVARL